jgi:2-aminoadipate transaminase
MDSTFSFSAASQRAFDSPISDLMALALRRHDVISLAAGFVDRATLPVESVDSALHSILTNLVDGRRSLQYGTTLGDPRLRHRLVDRMIDAGEIDPSQRDALAHRSVVTNGSQQLLFLLTEALVEPGDIVLVESPTYFVYLNVLRRFGARVIGIPTDSGGLRVEDLETILSGLQAEGQLPRVKMVYTISEHSNPSGLSLAADRRPRLLETVKRFSTAHRILVVEDAAYRGLNFDQAEPPSVWSHDPDGQMVVHARTFSKTFSPGLKVGWGILPSDLVQPIHNLKEGHDFGTAHFNQQLLDRVLEDGGLDAHIQTLRGTYRIKRDAMLGALEAHMKPLDGAVTWTHPQGGLYVWLTVPEEIDMGPSGPIFNRCLDEGVLYVPGALAFAREPNEPPANHARLSYGVAGVAAIEEGIRRLACALAECLDPVGASRR